jgi:glycosyltransferase involved in cell wall biosynthesis
MIKVVVDIRDLQIATTGTKTFLEALCKEFKNGHSGFQFYFLSPKSKPYTGTNKILKIKEHLLFFIWKQIQLPYLAYRLKANIVFCSDYFVPYLQLGFTTIPVFHDAFFKEYPTHYNRWWLQIFNTIGLGAAKRAAFIVTPTQYALETIHQQYHLDKNKTRVIYEAGKETAIETNTTTFFESEWFTKLKKKEYILHVGTYDKRKNIPRLIEGFAHLVHQNEYAHLKLVLVGASANKINSNDTEEIHQCIQSLQLGNKVVQTGYVADNELAHFYQNALLYVFPSINEGFGLPVLEAFKYEVPVLIANNTCLPEVAGNAALSFDPLDVNDMVVKMKEVIDSPVLKKKMIALGLERLQFFSWQKTTGLLLAVFKEAVKEKL